MTESAEPSPWRSLSHYEVLAADFESAGEHGFVHGHFLDEQGQSPANCSFAHGRYQGELKNVSLAPGESMELPVTFSHDGQPEPGSYGIEAIMVSLNLRSPKGTLEII